MKSIKQERIRLPFQVRLILIPKVEVAGSPTQLVSMPKLFVTSSAIHLAKVCPNSQLFIFIRI